MIEFQLSEQDRRILDYVHSEALVVRKYAREWDDRESELPPNELPEAKDYPGVEPLLVKRAEDASRSIVWLAPDTIVVYDRAASKTDGRFKRFWLNLPAERQFIYLADGTNQKVYIIDRQSLQELTSFGDGGRQPGQFFGTLQVDPAAPTFTGACAGGIVATNAAGATTFKYGSTRPWVEALTVVLADGTPLRLERGRSAAAGDGTHFRPRRGPPG